MSILEFKKCSHEKKEFDFSLGEEQYYYCQDCQHELLFVNKKLEKAWKSELGPIRKVATARKGVFHFLMKLQERKIIEK